MLRTYCLFYFRSVIYGCKGLEPVSVTATAIKYRAISGSHAQFTNSLGGILHRNKHVT